MSRLPNGLPMSFGSDSPFPPMASPRLDSRPSAPPPLPPSRAEALQREQQLRQQQQWRSQANFSARPGQLVSQTNGGGMGRMPGGQPFSQYGMAHTPSNSRLMGSPRPDVGSGRPMSPRPPAGMPFAQSPAPPPAMPSARPSSQFARPMPMPVPMPTPGSAPRISSPALQPSLSASFESMHIQNSGTSYNGDKRRTSSSTERPASVASTSSHDHTSLSIKLPDLEELRRRRDAEINTSDDRRKALWCKDVLRFVERKLDGNRISDPLLVQLVDHAINLINRLATAHPPLAEALYLRGDMLATGSFPSYHPRDLRTAFNDFELSARMGYAPSWFRIGRDYEVLEDMARSRDAYERGCSVQDVGCIYRLGMANLLGQLELSTDHARAIPLIREAADLANVDTPQPSFVYGMLLAGEFNHVQVAKHLLLPNADVNRRHVYESEARKRIQRAAYLNFAPAQFRMGYLHEYAELECNFDPLLSVQYYSLASQGGEVEADLALSKWFLCGAEGCFEKNESLAFTFADKAAAKGLASAEFAMGYYFEVGVGCEKELEVAKKWYRKAASNGNEDAKQRLDALDGPEPSALSRLQHEAHVDNQLQRKRTEAKMLSDRRSMRASARPGGSGNGDRPPASSGHQAAPMPVAAPAQNSRSSMELHRRNTMRLVEETSQKAYPAGSSSRMFQQQAAPPVNSPAPIRTPPPNQRQQQQSGRPPSAQQYSTPPPAARPAGRPARPAQPAMAHSSPGSAPPPRRGSDAPAGHAHNTPNTSSSGKPAGPSNTIPVLSAPSMGPDTKVYETFGQMGFTANTAKSEKDCVIC